MYNPYDPFHAANSLLQQVQAGAAGGGAGGLGGHHADPRLHNLAAVAASSLAAAGGNHAASAAAMAAQLNALAAQGRGNPGAAGTPHGGFGHLAGLPAGLSLQAAVANQAAAAYSAGGLPPG